MCDVADTNRETRVAVGARTLYLPIEHIVHTVTVWCRCRRQTPLINRGWILNTVSTPAPPLPLEPAADPDATSHVMYSISRHMHMMQQSTAPDPRSRIEGGRKERDHHEFASQCLHVRLLHDAYNGRQSMKAWTSHERSGGCAKHACATNTEIRPRSDEGPIPRSDLRGEQLVLPCIRAVFKRALPVGRGARLPVLRMGGGVLAFLAFLLTVG
mmetsp:Transcript_10468/g.23965  ORF Transcript_10468/g.23965 Transcript_10468/m.23965 type:complete len:213 (-) Transcript_10468:335-973(-)